MKKIQESVFVGSEKLEINETKVYLCFLSTQSYAATMKGTHLGLCLKEKGQYIDNSTLHWGRMLSTSAAASTGPQHMKWERSKEDILHLFSPVTCSLGLPFKGTALSYAGGWDVD